MAKIFFISTKNNQSKSETTCPKDRLATGWLRPCSPSFQSHLYGPRSGAIIRSLLLFICLSVCLRSNSKRTSRITTKIYWGHVWVNISTPIDFRKFLEIFRFSDFFQSMGTLLALLLWTSVLQAAVAHQHRAAGNQDDDDLPLYNWGPRAIHIPLNMTPLVYKLY